MLNREVQLFASRKESYTIPLSFIDFIRSTDADLRFQKEKGMFDCWDVDKNGYLLES